jgi:hypothetical protein
VLDYRGVIGIRISMGLALVAVAGCATVPAPVSPTGSVGRAAPVARCSDADPDRHGLFCFVGRLLYVIGAQFQTDRWTAR